MKTGSVLAAALVGVLTASAGGASPVTKEQLLSMSREKVDPKVIRAIVSRDCVDFDVDAENAAELSRSVAPEVLETAISCRHSGAGRQTPPSASVTPAAPAPPADVAPPAPPAPATSASPAAVSGDGSLRLSAEFIGESGALSCSCLLDGRPVATLTKEPQGEFGQAVPRAKIRRQSGDLPVPPGKHRLIFRCDPKAQEISEEIEIEPGRLRTVQVRETTLRHWKLLKID